MTDTSTAQQGGGAAAPAAPQAPQAPAQAPAAPARAPRNDIEAAQMGAATATGQAPAAEPSAQPAADPEKTKRNRTRDYIERLQHENATLRRQVGSGQQPPTQNPTQRTAQGAQQDEPEPKMEDFDFDQSRWMQAMIQHGVRKTLREQAQQQQQTQANESATKTAAAYNARAFEFSEQHPDFWETVSAIKYEIPEAVQFAIMSHDMGVEIAYHLGNNDDDAFTLASTQPHLAAAAVERIASRLKAAQPPPATPAAPAAPAAPAPASAPPPQTNHLSNAPPPAPTVGGRAPVETPPEKMTDDDWYKRDVERRRKR